jgi:very-short-patch-repair endonuclease
MRQDATQGENTLWQAIRNKQLGGLKFKRQFPLENCILDFVCLEARLIIELDGCQHSSSNADIKRDLHFARLRFRTLRFWNDEVTNNLDGVCSHILREALNERENKSYPLPCDF